ncbi:serine hydrolase [Deinococcus sp. Leaf326]|uniref:serine hydrolase domain-containing protein n=1 Tax=Deinococcus sp. Leaf326 TaxID=1736338 RepID=UPI0006FBEF6B|nr:serine hydrolase domain-containing protein [Deinococcus sp. Leaf326]KQR08761.1 serine hydrolase [Deinococcus sp. Leaf326]
MFRRDPLRTRLAEVADLLDLGPAQGGVLPAVVRAALPRGGVLGVSRAGTRLLVPVGGVPTAGVFELASVTKPFTAALASALVTRGALDWDTPLRRLGGPLRGLPLHFTARRLAVHTAGVPGHPARAALTSLTHFHDPYGRMTGAQALASARRWSRETRPPTFLYSNLSVGVLALALAHAAGEDLSAAGYGAALARYVTGPLGLPRTGLRPPPGELVTPRGLLGGSEATGFGPLAGAGGLFAPAADLLTFGEAHLSGAAGEHWKAGEHPRGLPLPRAGATPGWFITPPPGPATPEAGWPRWHDGVARGTRTALGFSPASGAVVTVLARGGLSLLGTRNAAPALALLLLGAAVPPLTASSQG